MKGPVLIVTSLCLIALGVVTAQKHKVERGAARARAERLKAEEAARAEVSGPGALSHLAFQELAEEVMGRLPVRPELRAANGLDDLAIQGSRHAASAGKQLGRIAQAIRENPGLASDGSEFYRRCSSSESLAISVRALCYARFAERNPTIALAVPDSVRNVARNITN